MNTQHHVLEGQILTDIARNNISDSIEIDENFKRGIQFDQIYTISQIGQNDMIPTGSLKSDASLQNQVNLASYSGQAYLLTTTADGTQVLQPLHDQALNSDIPPVPIENLLHAEEENAPNTVANIISVESDMLDILKPVSGLRKLRPFKCDQCTATFLDLAELEEHKSKHTDDGPYTCVDCHFSFMFKSHFRSHRSRCEKKRSSMPFKPYIVDNPVKHKFPKNNILKKALLASPQDSNMASSSKKSNISKHVPIRFNPKNPSFKRLRQTAKPDRPWECDQCDATFKLETEFLSHMSKHTGEGPFSCDDCSFVFMFKKLHESHMRRCTKKRMKDSNNTNLVSTITNKTVCSSQNQLITNSNVECSPVFTHTGIVESSVLQVHQNTLIDENVAAPTSNHRHEMVKYELLPAVELDVNMGQIVNLIKVKPSSQ